VHCRALSMTNIPPPKKVSLLINILDAERYVRRPLLQELLDELQSVPASGAAVEAARRLASEMERGIDDDGFKLAIEGIARLVH
jgi:hypothetical protein